MNSRDRKRRGHSRYYVYFVLSLVALVLVGGAIFYLLRSLSIFDVKKIEVSGNHAVGDSLIAKFTGKYVGQNLFSVPTHTLKKELTSLSRVKSVRIRKRLMHTLNVAITERQGILYIKTLEGDLFPVDESGIVLTRYGKVYIEDLPIMSTYFSTAKLRPGIRLKGKDLDRVLTFHKKLMHDAADFVPRVSEYYVIDNTIYMIDANTGMRIIPGDEDLQAQLRRYIFVLENGNIGNHKLLDLRYSKQVVVKAETQ